jgi:hypothetical protein
MALAFSQLYIALAVEKMTCGTCPIVVKRRSVPGVISDPLAASAVKSVSNGDNDNDGGGGRINV